MNVVSPETRTTLLLNESYLPINVTTAHAALRQVITGRTKPIDRFGVVHGFAECGNIRRHGWFQFKDDYFTDEQLKNNTSIYFDNQPVLRSAHESWPIPSIAITTSKFFRKSRTKNESLHTLAKRYGYICQICERKFSIRELTREHVIPRSKNGSNESSNYLPTCRACNEKKADIYPYYDVNGKLLEKKIKHHAHMPLTSSSREHRPEWENYLVFKH